MTGEFFPRNSCTAAEYVAPLAERLFEGGGREREAGDSLLLRNFLRKHPGVRYLFPGSDEHHAAGGVVFVPPLVVEARTVALRRLKHVVFLKLGLIRVRKRPNDRYVAVFPGLAESFVDQHLSVGV